MCLTCLVYYDRTLMPACNVQSYVNDPAVLNVRLTVALVVAAMLAGAPAPPANVTLWVRDSNTQFTEPLARYLPSSGEWEFVPATTCALLGNDVPVTVTTDSANLVGSALRCGADVRRARRDCSDFPGLIHGRSRSATAAPRYELRGVVADRDCRRELTGITDGPCERRRRHRYRRHNRRPRRHVWLQTACLVGSKTDVAVIVTLPGATAETSPVALTVATAVALLLQVTAVDAPATTETCAVS